MRYNHPTQNKINFPPSILQWLLPFLYFFVTLITINHQSLFYYWLFSYWRQGENWEGAQRKKKTPHCLESLLGSYIPGPWDHDPSQRQSLNGLSHRGAPLLLVYFTIIFQKNVSSLWSGILYVLLIEVFSER